MIEGRELDAGQKQLVAQCRVNVAVAEGLQFARAGGADDVVEEFLEIRRKGVLPTQNTFGFWHLLARHAAKKGDAQVLEASIAGLRGVFGPDDERMNKWLAKFEKRLAELKAAHADAEPKDK